MRECDIFHRMNAGFDEACPRAHARLRMWHPESEHPTARRFALYRYRVDSRLGCSEQSANLQSLSTEAST